MKTDGHSDVDDSGRDTDQEGVGDTRGLEESGSVVEDEVDSSQLLESLKEDSRPDSKSVSANTALEARKTRQVESTS